VRARLLVVAAVMALGITYVLLRSVGGAGPSDRPLEPPRVAPPVTALAEPLPGPPPPLRNVFEYSDGAIPPVAPPPLVRVAPAAPERAVPEPSPMVRLVGLLRRGGQLKVALAIEGETVVLAAGESAVGYTVISIDEEEGVRLRAPGGDTVVLRTASD
jgi:hypothetical protein